MEALPSLFALAFAVVLAPATRRALVSGGFVRENYRGRAVPFPFGVVIVFAAVAALVPLSLIARFSDTRALPDELAIVVPFALGVAFLGLADDALSGPERGWRGHARQLLSGGVSTRVLKAARAPGPPPFLPAGRPRRGGEYLPAPAGVGVAPHPFHPLGP